MLLKFFLLFYFLQLCNSQDNYYVNNVIIEKKTTKIPYAVTKPIIKRFKNSVRPVIKEIIEEEKTIVVTKPILKKFKIVSTTPMNYNLTSTEKKTSNEITPSNKITPSNEITQANTPSTMKSSRETSTDFSKNMNKFTTKSYLTFMESDNNNNNNNNNLDIDLLTQTLINCKYKFYEKNSEDTINHLLTFFNDDTTDSNYHFSIKIIEKYLPLFNKNKNNIENVNKKMYDIKNNYDKINNFTKTDINIGIKSNRENFGTYLCSKIFKTLKGYENVLNVRIFSKNLSETPVCTINFSAFILPILNLDDFQFVIQQQVVIPLEHLPAYKICDNGKLMINC